jgi:hypothetical protein
METGLRISYLWHDIDVVEVSITVSNSRFGGLAQAYIDHDGLRNAASTLEGFRTTPSDARELSLGNMDPQFAGGGALLRFFCTNNACHAAVEIRIVNAAQSETNLWTRPPESAHFFAKVEAAAIDNFVRELRAFDPNESRCAFLAIIGDY